RFGRLSITTFALTHHSGLMQASRIHSFLIPPHEIACLGYSNRSYPRRCTPVASSPLCLHGYSWSAGRYPLGEPFSHLRRCVSHSLPFTTLTKQVPSPPYRNF